MLYYPTLQKRVEKGEVSQEEVIECARIEAGMESLSIRLATINPNSEDAQSIRAAQAELGEKLRRFTRPD